MLSEEIAKLEKENIMLKQELEEIKEKMERKEIPKPKCCQYCKNFIQHFAKDSITGGFVPIYAGHCRSSVTVKKGGKRNPKPDDVCPYFELGANNCI